MSKFWSGYWVGVVVMAVVGLVIDVIITVRIVDEPQEPYTVVYESDCYVGEDYTHKIVSARKTQSLLKELTERKLK